jgi:hypothetical protein
MTITYYSRVPIKEGGEIQSLPTPVIEKIVNQNNYTAKWDTHLKPGKVYTKNNAASARNVGRNSDGSPPRKT